MTRGGFLCFLGFQNFPGEDPVPPFQKCVVILQSNTAQHTSIVRKVRYITQEVNTRALVGSAFLVCDLLTKDLLYPLSVKYRAGKDQDPVKKC